MICFTRLKEGYIEFWDWFEFQTLNSLYYYTSEEIFLYNTSVDKWPIKHFTLEMNY